MHSSKGKIESQCTFGEIWFLSIFLALSLPKKVFNKLLSERKKQTYTHSFFSFFMRRQCPEFIILYLLFHFDKVSQRSPFSTQSVIIPLYTSIVFHCMGSVIKLLLQRLKFQKDDFEFFVEVITFSLLCLFSLFFRKIVAYMYLVASDRRPI